MGFIWFIQNIFEANLNLCLDFVPHIDIQKIEKDNKELGYKSRKSNDKPKLALSNKAKTTRAGTVVGIKNFNDALNTQKRAVQRLKSVKNLNQKEETNPQLSRLQTKIDKSVQDLYKQYISSDFNSLKEKVWLADKLLQSLKANDK